MSNKLGRPPPSTNRAKRRSRQKSEEPKKVAKYTLFKQNLPVPTELWHDRKIFWALPKAAIFCPTRMVFCQSDVAVIKIGASLLRRSQKQLNKSFLDENDVSRIYSEVLQLGTLYAPQFPNIAPKKFFVFYQSTQSWTDSHKLAKERNLKLKVGTWSAFVTDERHDRYREWTIWDKFEKLMWTESDATIPHDRNASNLDMDAPSKSSHQADF